MLEAINVVLTRFMDAVPAQHAALIYFGLLVIVVQATINFKLFMMYVSIRDKHDECLREYQKDIESIKQAFQDAIIKRVNGNGQHNEQRE